MAALRRLGMAMMVAGLLPIAAQADVPRACVYPRYDPIECPRQWREGQRRVLPSARVRILDQQRARLERLPLRRLRSGPPHPVFLCPADPRHGSPPQRPSH